MKKLAQLATFIMVALSISFFVTSVQLPELPGQADTSIELVWDLDHDMSDNETEDDNNEMEFHETEFYLNGQKYVFSSKASTLLFLENLHVFLPSYIFTIYVPPLTHSLS